MSSEESVMYTNLTVPTKKEGVIVREDGTIRRDKRQTSSFLNPSLNPTNHQPADPHRPKPPPQPTPTGRPTGRPKDPRKKPKAAHW